MTSAKSDVRRYLLGEASEQQRSAIEEEYFADEQVLAVMEAEEDDLIEAYLASALGPEERARFERAYLSAAHRRRRVETVRLLTDAARRSRGEAGAHATTRFARSLKQTWRHRATPFWAAAAVVVAIASSWLLVVRHERSQPAGNASATQPSLSPAAPAQAQRAPEPNQSPARAETIIAFALSPINVRSADESPALTLPRGATLVSLRLQGETRGADLSAGRVVVRTMSGDEVWSGPAAGPRDRTPGVVAQVDIPAERLHHDDYIVELFTTNARGVEQELNRYFLRVRER